MERNNDKPAVDVGANINEPIDYMADAERDLYLALHLRLRAGDLMGARQVVDMMARLSLI